MVFTTAYFLKRDELWQKEKPYTLRFQPDPSVNLPRSNVLRELFDLQIHDMRSIKEPLSFDKQGFTHTEIASALAYEDYFNETLVKEKYYTEVEATLRNLLGATWVRIFQHTVRKRHPDFPVSTGSDYDFNQPALMAHIDSTLEFTLEQAQEMIQGGEELPEGRIMLVHAWKPLKGPLHDWPLALCDSSTVDTDLDILRGDIVYPTHVIENYQVHYSKQQKWYYLEGQSPTELLVFKQSDSDSKACLSVPHTSFYNPLAPVTESPRESIETRAIVFIAEEQSTKTH